METTRQALTRKDSVGRGMCLDSRVSFGWRSVPTGKVSCLPAQRRRTQGSPDPRHMRLLPQSEPEKQSSPEVNMLSWRPRCSPAPSIDIRIYGGSDGRSCALTTPSRSRDDVCSRQPVRHATSSCFTSARTIHVTLLHHLAPIQGSSINSMSMPTPTI